MIILNDYKIREVNDDLLFTELPAFDFNSTNIESMCELMKKVQNIYGGVGISANQCLDISQPTQVAIVGCDDNKIIEKISQRYPNKECPVAFEIINPTILEMHHWYFPESGEGCLSVQGPLRARIKRYKDIKVKYFNIQQEIISTNFSNFSAHIFQHEFDHLHGKMYLDYVFENCDMAQLIEILQAIESELNIRWTNNIIINEYKPTKDEPINIIFDMTPDNKIKYDLVELDKAIKLTTNNTLSGLKNRLLSKYIPSSNIKATL